MKFLFLLILKQFYDLENKLHLLSPENYRKRIKPYYREKTILFAKWHNFLAKNRVSQYFKQHTNSAKSVIYTCLTGGYDELLAPSYINPHYDYICFTDDKNMIAKKYIGPWKIEPLKFSELDNSKNNRWHKMQPHILFPNYESSIYIDSNVNFKTAKIFEYIQALPNQCFIALPHHAKRDCIYDEAEFVVNVGFDTKEKVAPLIEIYRKEGFPEHFGLAENNIIYRKHNTPECAKIMDEWWDIFLKYSRRDQLSLFYLFWKNKTDYTFFAPTPFKKDHKNFRIYKHKG